ncbi:MAG: CHAT domain-containing protein, partial [Sphaerospermopsis kisseleviana]
FSYRNPLESSLVLAQGQCITLRNLVSDKLPHCSLMTLSACESGLTDIADITDAFVGLPGGLLIAGAKAVVSSLWLVKDLATALLMIKFYEYLINSKSSPQSVSIALNQAQQWLRKATTADLIKWSGALPLEPELKLELRGKLRGCYHLNDIPFANPYYWAAFCAIGQ